MHDRACGLVSLRFSLDGSLYSFYLSLIKKEVNFKCTFLHVLVFSSFVNMFCKHFKDKTSFSTILVSYNPVFLLCYYFFISTLY